MTSKQTPPPGFEIPPAYQSLLTFSPAKETRSDEELLGTLETPPPVTSEKNIWAFWDTGIKSMPAWCKRNITAWMRINPGWTVRVLDQLPLSPNYALNFVPREMMPRTFYEGTMEGDVKGQHASDFIRGAVIYLHGGVYMDVGCILFRSLDRVCWNALLRGPHTVACPTMGGMRMANHFIAGRKDDQFVKHWHDLFAHVWSDRTSPSGLIANPLWTPFIPPMQAEVAADTRWKWDFKVAPITIFEYITQVMCWYRLCHIQEPGPNGFDGYNYWREKVLVWDSLVEHWPVEDMLGFTNGQEFMDLMAVRRDDTSNGKWEKARDLVFRLLGTSTMQKVTHGKNLTHSIALGVLLDLTENAGKDVAPGTFFELLRYGAVNFEQTREEVAYVPTPTPTLIVRKGVQEP